MLVMQRVESLYREIGEPESLDVPAHVSEPDGESRGDRIAADTPNQDELAQRSQEIKSVRDALRALETRERVALMLTHGIAGEFAPEEIAQVLGVSVDTVRVVIRSARAKVRLHLQDAGVRG